MTRTTRFMTTAFVLLAGLVAVTRSEAKRITQGLPPAVSNLEMAKEIEVKNASNRAILAGSFSKSSEKGNEIELAAVLAATGIDADANGKAEIEIEKKPNATTNRELEVTLKNLAGAATFKLFVDGNEFATFTTDKSGKADLKFTSKHQ